MKVYNVVFCEANVKDPSGVYVAVYSYATLKKAIDGAIKMVKEIFLDNNEELFNGDEVVSLEKLRQLLKMQRWYCNVSDEKHMTESFWVRIDENVVEE